MGHKETPVHRQVVNELVFTDQAGATVGISGRVILSGTKLEIDTGNDWNEVTSA